MPLPRAPSFAVGRGSCAHRRRTRASCRPQGSRSSLASGDASDLLPEGRGPWTQTWARPGPGTRQGSSSPSGPTQESSTWTEPQAGAAGTLGLTGPLWARCCPQVPSVWALSKRHLSVSLDSLTLTLTLCHPHCDCKIAQP